MGLLLPGRARMDMSWILCECAHIDETNFAHLSQSQICLSSKGKWLDAFPSMQDNCTASRILDNRDITNSD